jgi:Flp pilus assembly protein TadD
LDRDNEYALRLLAFLGTLSGEIGTAARKVYDPSTESDVPAAVLTELAGYAFQNDEFEKAIEYYEQARKKQPRNPQILNNLAYAYLKAEDRNPVRALLFVDQAIQYSGLLPAAEYQISISNFYHTRGTALMQMDRLSEAAGEFEKALHSRPNNIELLKNLESVYQALNDERQAEVYRRRREKAEQEQKLQSSNN